MAGEVADVEAPHDGPFDLGPALASHLVEIGVVPRVFDRPREASIAVEEAGRVRDRSPSVGVELGIEREVHADVFAAVAAGRITGPRARHHQRRARRQPVPERVVGGHVAGVGEAEVVAGDDQQLGVGGVPELLGERGHGRISVPVPIGRIRWVASGLVRKRCLVLGVAFLTLAACSGGGSDRAAPTSAPVAPTTAPRHRAPTTASTSSDTCPGFHGSTTVLQSSGPTAPASLIDATAGAQGCLDAVTFTFRSLGDGTPPGYAVGYRDPVKDPFLDGDPPSPIDVPGNAFLVVRIEPALSIDPFAPDAPLTYTGNLSLEYGDHHHLQIVRELPDGKNNIEWVIGLDSVRPFRVDRAENPTRVTVLIG